MTCACSNSNSGCLGPNPQDVQAEDFNVVAGDTFSDTWQLIDSITAEPDDITNWQFYLSVYQSWAARVSSATPFFKLTNGNGFNIVDGLGGQLGISITAVQTAIPTIPAPDPYSNDVPQNNCIYDFVAIDDEGNIRTEMRGQFTFQMRLTVTS